MSIEAIHSAARAAAAALVRQRAPAARFLSSRRSRCPTVQGYFKVNRVDRAAAHCPVAGPSWSA